MSSLTFQKPKRTTVQSHRSFLILCMFIHEILAVSGTQDIISYEHFTVNHVKFQILKFLQIQN